MTQDILDKIANNYSLGGFIFLKRNENGISGENAIVENENKTLFFIKNYKKNDADIRTAAEHVEILVKERSVVPVILPIENINKTRHIVLDGEMYAIFPYIQNEEYQPKTTEEKNKLIEDLGSVLGQIHATPMSASAPQLRKTLGYELKSKDQNIKQLQEIQKLIEDKPVRDDYDVKALSLILLKISLAENIIPKEDTVNETIVHGDFHRGNILFSEKGEIIGVCDWDNSGRANPYLEFIRSFNMCVIRRHFDTYQNNQEATKAFLRGYIKSCGFSFQVKELENAIQTWLDCLILNNWPMSDHYFLNKTKGDDSIDSERSKIVFLKEQKSELLGHIVACL